MGPKKGRRVRKIEVFTDSVPEFELGDTAADIQQRKAEREARQREEAQKQREQEARREEEARMEETHSQEEEVAETRPRTERSETEARGEAGPSQSRYKKGHMTNIYLTDLDEEAIVDYVKDHEELYDKTNEHFKDTARMEQFATVASCLSRCIRPGLSHRGHLMAS